MARILSLDEAIGRERAWDEMPDEEQQKNAPWVPWPDLGVEIDVRKGRKKRDDD